MEFKLEKVVKTYYETLNEGKVLGRKCPKCGNVEWPPVYACNNCGNFFTEFVQLSGRAQVIEIHSTTPMTAKPAYKDLEPYAYAWVKLEEGPERNVMLRGVTRENIKYIQNHLPYPCHLDIVQRDGYKTAVCAIDPIDGEGRMILKVENTLDAACNEQPVTAPVAEPVAEVKAPATGNGDTVQKIIALVAEAYKMDAATLNESSSFQKDIKGPSVVFLGLSARIEDVFDIELSMTEASSANTIGELATLVDSLV